MVGGGQLARMTHQAAIALGQSLRVLAVSPDEPAPLVAPDIVLGSHTDLVALRAFAEGRRRGHLRPRARADRAPAGAGRRRRQRVPRPGRPGARPGQARDARAAGRAGRADAAVSQVESVDDVVAFGDGHGWPCVLKAARGGYDGRGVWMPDSPMRPATRSPSCSTAGTPLLVEQRVPMRRELAALVARSPVRAGRGLADRGDRAGQRHLCRGAGARARPGRGPGRPAQELALGSRRRWAWSGCWRSSCSRRPGLVVNELAMRPHNSGHWTIDGSPHLPVRAAPAGRAGLPARRDRRVRAGRRDGQRARCRRPPTMGVDERLHHLFARFGRTRRCTCTARRSGRAARSGTSPCSATTWHRRAGIGVARRALAGHRPVGRRLRRPRLTVHPGKRAELHVTDAVPTTPIVGVIMGSDSDWPVMAGRSGSARRVRRRPTRSRVVSAHRTPQRMLDYAEPARPSVACG